MAKANELLDRMRSENKTITKGPENPYVQLIISHQRRQILMTASIAAFIAFLVILLRAKHEQAAWMVSALPIGGLGLMISLIKPVEEWEYIPWQTRARQYERHQVERL